METSFYDLVPVFGVLLNIEHQERKQVLEQKDHDLIIFKKHLANHNFFANVVDIIDENDYNGGREKINAIMADFGEYRHWNCYHGFAQEPYDVQIKIYRKIYDQLVSKYIENAKPFDEYFEFLGVKLLP